MIVYIYYNLFYFVQYTYYSHSSDKGWSSYRLTRTQKHPMIMDPKLTRLCLQLACVGAIYVMYKIRKSHIHCIWFWFGLFENQFFFVSSFYATNIWSVLIRSGDQEMSGGKITHFWRWDKLAAWEVHIFHRPKLLRVQHKSGNAHFCNMVLTWFMFFLEVFFLNDFSFFYLYCIVLVSFLSFHNKLSYIILCLITSSYLIWSSILFYSILFYSILFYSILFYSILFYYHIISYHIISYHIISYHIILFILYYIILYSILFYSILFYSILFYSILFYYIILYYIILYYIISYHIISYYLFYIICYII